MATPVSTPWNGDRYVVYEQKKTKRLLLIGRLDLATEADAERFFATYSLALEKKYERRTSEDHQRGLLSFDTADGGVFLRCVGTDCATLEGGDRSLFEKFNSELHWDALPAKGVRKSTARRRAGENDALRAQESALTSSAIRK